MPSRQITPGARWEPPLGKRSKSLRVFSAPQEKPQLGRTPDATPCQTPRVRCEHESDPAGPPSSPLGRRPAGRWAKAKVSPQERSARCPPTVPSRRAARHRADAQGSLEPSHAPVLQVDQARPRARLPTLRVPARAVLRLGQPPLLDVFSPST